MRKIFAVLVISLLLPLCLRAAAPALTEAVVWAQALETVARSLSELTTQHEAELARGLAYHKFFHGNPRHKLLALTFDDGPHPRFTPRLLALLREQHVKATFFVVGEMAARHPELIKAEIADGHNVGNHTYHHVNLTKIPTAQVGTEIVACGKTLEAITGKAPHLFRPPGGDYNRGVAEAAEAAGYTTVLWSDDPGDYASPGNAVIESRMEAQASNGGVILIHDGIEQTLQVLPYFIATMRARGYTFVTVDALIADAHRPCPKKAGSPLVHHGVLSNLQPGKDPTHR